VSDTDPFAGLIGWDPPLFVDRDAFPRGPVDALSAVLGSPLVTGNDVPPLWHWLYFLDWPADLGDDGHPRDGHFMPPIADRRRMWAGGRLTRHRPLRFGVETERRATLASATVKHGRSGPMALVTTRVELWQPDGLTVVEEVDHVYRSGEDRRREIRRASGDPAGSDAPWHLEPVLDSRLLFRFSALTGNSHRIHYDEPYARQVERYPGLVVHGPLLVLLMLDLLRRRPELPHVREVMYRLHAPVFADDRVLVTGSFDHGLAVLGAGGTTHATAKVTFW
jgi:hydroxyacyl-ACP dehydratase HTD2-like protein with hotdog domain